MKLFQWISDGFWGKKINSGEEFDYKYVENNGHYNLNSFNRSGMFVLPPNPEIGTTIYFADGEGSTRWFPVKIHRNGNPIMAEDEHMSCDVPNVNFKMEFVGGYMGWLVEADLRFVPKQALGGLI
jgi:hypothetical protein